MKNIEEKLNNLKIETRPFINGKYVNAASNKKIEKISSIDGKKLPSLDACEKEDIDIAVQVALQTYKSRIWVDKDKAEKKRLLLKFADLVEENLEELALLDTIETGRSFKNYYYDSIPKAIEALRWFAEAIDKVYDKSSIQSKKNSSAIITREPLGVVGIITPWNDPLVVAFWKLAPALLMGNSVILKPAEFSSYSILKVAKLAIEVGIPKGVFNVVPGYGEIAGKALGLHNDVRAIFFTGSSEVGKLIMQYAGQSNMKKVGLECGGKSPFIVSQKCNQLEKAVETLAKNIFYNQGQICSASSRLIIDKKIKNEFLEILLKESKKYIPDNPLNINTEVGAIVNETQKNRIEKYVKSGIEEGAKLLTGGKEVKIHDKGCYFMPTIFDEVDSKSKIAREEIFGPVLVVSSVENIKEAIEMANDLNYGLAASVWTNDYDEAYQVSRLLEAGIVHINSYGDDDNTVPFGGVKESGIGKDKSIYAFDEYSNLKTIWMKFREL